ncbi:MAG: hypothetical protein NZM42_10545, partial [Gemmatales bacterium]|nr:hypothetical protein [Gemmatales bacterium]
MYHELLFTSAERGLDLGMSGYCTVKRTRGMSKRLERLLHELSVYKAKYPPHDPNFSQNPVVFMHCRASVDGQMVSILSRIGAAPPDYSGRSNYLAHHIVLCGPELPQAGPVWLAKQPGFFVAQWDGQVAELAGGRPVPRGESTPRRCTTWERVTGDAGWAGTVLKYLADNPTMPFYLIVEESMPVLDLLDEVVALLPPEKRWSATFTTRYIYLPGSVTCAGRVVPLGSEKIGEAKASARCLDLTALRGKRPPDNPYTEAARSGQHVATTDQHLRAEDEPALPPSLQAFSQVQVAGPIRHNPGLSVPQVPVTPAPPPPVAANPPTSRMPLWLVLFTLFHFVLTGGLAAFLYLAHRAQHELKEEFKQELAQQSSDIKSLRESASKNLQEETAKLQSSVEQTRKAVVVELEAQLKALRKELANARSEFEKRTAEIENNLLQERQEIKKLVSLLANREQ